FSLETIYITLTTVFFVAVFYFSHKKLKLALNPTLIILYAVLSQITFYYYAIVSKIGIINILVYIFLLVFAILMFISVLQMLILRGVYYKTTLTESIAIIFLFICLGMGITNICFYNFNYLKLVAVCLIFFFALINKNKEACFISLALGVGSAITSFDLFNLANIAVLVFAINIFKSNQKYKIGASVILVDLCFNFYLNSINFSSLISILPTVLAVSLIICLPSCLTNQLQDRFYICESEMSMRNIVNITRSNLHKKFNELSNVFNEMKLIHLNLIKEDLSHEQVVNMLTNEIMKTLCKDCLDKQKCFRGLGVDGKSSVMKLIDIALTKGKITLLDIPSNLAMRCGIINLLIGRVNQIVSQYGQYVGMKKDINNVKYLLAEQLGAVSQIMLDLSDDINKHISFDSHKELQIINELLAENIVCSEVLLYNELDQEISVNLIVKGDNAYNPEIEKIISKKMKTQMRISTVEPIDVNGFYSVHLVKDNNFDIIFGISHCTKTGSEASGDSHSLIRLGNNRFLLAVCDGMGSGEKANITSALTVNLIENFYKAGFSNDMVIASVNKLLAVNNQENFATLDLCLVDLNKEIVDFIKVGAPYSFIKQDSEIEFVEGGALPIGVLENINPKVYKTAISTKSMIIMFSDGISDAFGDCDALNDYIKEIASINPQVVAQTIVDEAIRRNENVVKDDMTVLVARTFLKNA
ncbi:MAG: SpoIIE family protein phosphatase, partial [Clostridia bacterium]|nr:SpoIIE family protein phosphatase [Clostridia bacterium]